MNNNYFLLRHGEALSNQKKIISCWPEKSSFPLTEKGRKEIKNVVAKLKNKKPSTRAELNAGLVPHRPAPEKSRCRAGAGIEGIDLIFTSDLLRTRQTAEIIGKEIGIKPKLDKRLREYNTGIFNGKPIAEFRKFFGGQEKRFRIKPPKGETYIEIEKRMYEFLKDIDKKYSNKNILIISHQIPLVLLEGKVKGFSNKEFLKNYPKEKRIKTGELRELNS